MPQLTALKDRIILLRQDNEASFYLSLIQ